MSYTIEVRIELKKGVIDAEGETVKKSLNLLGYRIKDVNTVRIYAIKVEAGSENDAVEEINEACKRLLANPVIQNYSVTVK
ncbi:MAG: phosphoribosylformylglycinamidine synthase PurS protein [Candidatus Altiarchaeales archaeon ex4484_2]|nr:MAG: phosphoribosylformylglycinamidine synthase PurS protein [Candidatus Altiarchaeales archaeon ex4484_2]